MAVLQGVPGLFVEIQVAEQSAAEYGDPNEIIKGHPGTPTTSCYIESKSGAEFLVDIRIDSRFKFPGNRDSILADVLIDGIPQAARVLSPTKLHKHWRICAVMGPSKIAGCMEMRNFTFSSITAVDDHEKQRVAKDTEIACHLGTIQVLIHTATRVRSVNTEGDHYRIHQAQKLELSEKSMKGKELSHGTVFTNAKIVPRTRTTYSINKLTLGAFLFHYRSQDALEKEFIVPRPCLSSLAEDDMANLSEDEIRRLARERLKNIKDEDSATQKVKREPNSPPCPSRPFKLIRLDDGREAVDLTDD